MSKNLVGKAHAYYRLDVIFSLSFRRLSWRIECQWRNVSFNFGSWPGRDRRNPSRNAAEGRCWTSVCAFSSEDSDAECRVTITIPFFARVKQVPQSAWSKKKKKRLTCKTEKSQKIKSPRKSNPPQYLWGCFEGVFVPDLTRLGMQEGVFVPDLTRSGVRVRGLGLVWTSGPTRSDRDQHQTRSRTRPRNLTRLVSYVLLTSLLSVFDEHKVWDQPSFPSRDQQIQRELQPFLKKKKNIHFGDNRCFCYREVKKKNGISSVWPLWVIVGKCMLHLPLTELISDRVKSVCTLVSHVLVSSPTTEGLFSSSHCELFVESLSWQSQAFSLFFSTMASDELQSVSEMEQIMSYLRTLQADVQTGMQSMRSDLQSMSYRLQKVEKGESQSQTPSPSPRPAQRASTDVLPSLSSSSRSWADRVEQEEDDDAFEHSMDLDVEPGDDAKGIRIFPLKEATESFLSQAWSSPLPSQVRKQLRERFGKPNLPKATTPQLDNVMRPLMSSQAKGRDKELAKIQTFRLDAFAPLARYINEANSDSGQLSAADYLEMVRTSRVGPPAGQPARILQQVTTILSATKCQLEDHWHGWWRWNLPGCRTQAVRRRLHQEGQGAWRRTEVIIGDSSGPASWRPAQSANLSPFFSPTVKPQRETSPRLQSQLREATFWTLPPHSGIEEGRLTEVTGSTTTPGGDRVTSLVSIRNKNSENPNNFVVLSVEHGCDGYERRCDVDECQVDLRKSAHHDPSMYAWGSWDTWPL